MPMKIDPKFAFQPVVVVNIRPGPQPAYYYTDLLVEGVERTLLFSVTKSGGIAFEDRNFDSYLSSYNSSLGKLSNVIGRFHDGERFDFPVDLRTYKLPPPQEDDD